MTVAAVVNPRPHLRWGRILLCALLSALIALGLSYMGQMLMQTSPGPVMTWLCPAVPPTGDSYSDLLGSALGCMFVVVTVATLAYFVPVLTLSAILIQSLVHDRHLGHNLLSALVSVPMKF